MSKETHAWLANNVLIGFTDKRGNAWHYREGDGNHYASEVPVEDVRRRLFNWSPVERPVFVSQPNPVAGGNDLMFEVPQRKAITRSDNGAVLGIFSQSYRAHDFDTWLLKNAEDIMGQTLRIGSAGLLEGGAVGWVQYEMPDNVTTAEGVEFRPWLNVFGSFNGKFATTYKTGITNIVCDNTMAAARAEKSESYRVKSTAHSLARVDDARTALGLIITTMEEFEAEVRLLCATEFTDKNFEALVADLAPIAGDAKQGRSLTMAENKRDALWELWNSDDRVTPWHGTAWGATQAVNTYGQHVQSVRGGNRPERNMKLQLSGKIEEQDIDTVRRVMTLALSS